MINQVHAGRAEVSSLPILSGPSSYSDKVVCAFLLVALLAWRSLDGDWSCSVTHMLIHFLLLEREGSLVSDFRPCLSTLAASGASAVTRSTTGGLFLCTLTFALISDKPRHDPSPW